MYASILVVRNKNWSATSGRCILLTVFSHLCVSISWALSSRTEGVLFEWLSSCHHDKLSRACKGTVASVSLHCCISPALYIFTLSYLLWFPFTNWSDTVTMPARSIRTFLVSKFMTVWGHAYNFTRLSFHLIHDTDLVHELITQTNCQIL